MGSRRLLNATVVVFALLSSACATGAEWAAWKQHPAHFASSDHGIFSVRNREGRAPRVTREDLAEARAQGWWGDPVSVAQAQILAR